MTTTLQSCLECLDRLNDKIISVYGEMVEIRTRITELLQGMLDYEHQNIATFAPDEANATLPLLSMLDPSGLSQPLAYSRLSDQEYGPLNPVKVMGSLLEDAGSMIVYDRRVALRHLQL
ncbi:hypothetical protein BDR04DRAFT_1106801 [Suillus decipiens]|nr:hypothetical protein BDR04DRAFT_1106801 [Suillus decipiens]